MTKLDPRKLGLDDLPDEAVLNIITCLQAPDITTVQAACRRMLAIGRDNNLWRQKCFDSSAWERNRQRRGIVDYVTTISFPSFKTEKITKIDQSKKRILANWDPSYPGENVNWYQEYIQRNAPIAVSWLQQPRDRDNLQHMEVRGTGIYHGQGDPGSSIAVSPLDDGSVCLWDLMGSSGRKGRIIGRSHAGIFGISNPGPSSVSTIPEGITDCVSVDNLQKRAHIAIQSDLFEIDLETLQVISSTRDFPYPITTISSSCSTDPLIIGTHKTIHLHDTRLHPHRRGTSGTVLDPLLSISNIPDSNSIYAAGRFPSILSYDQRYFPVVKETIYTGSRLSSLAVIPYAYRRLDRGRLQYGTYSVPEMDFAKTRGGNTLIAAGEYGSHGSLELYQLEKQEGQDPLEPLASSCNRQSASRSKLLSVTNHGTRIVFSDGDGNLKWMERDGHTEVRGWNIGRSGFQEAFGTGVARLRPEVYDMTHRLVSGDLVRKIMHTHPDKAGNNDDLVLWTGEKLGLLSFSSKAGFTAESFEEISQTAEEAHLETQERAYEGMMRVALERQADEVRFMSGLGLGMR